MTLEFEKLTTDIDRMATVAAERQKTRTARASEMRALIHEKATAWDEIDRLVDTTQAAEDLKYYRPARTISHDEPLDAAVPAPPPPDRATIIATDGSQILPDRHAAFAYYLINIGALVYHHGTSREPGVLSSARLGFPDDEDLSDEDQGIDAATASIERDLGEITMVTEIMAEQPELARPLLGLLDQRLLYWPFGQRNDADKVAYEWGRQMSAIHNNGGLLAGYIDRPGKRSVVSLLRGLASPEVTLKDLDRPQASGMLIDINLFSDILGPGERSCVFVEISPVNVRFRRQDVDNEIAFFYYNPASARPDASDMLGPALARIDIPMWVARDPAAVALVHALIESQCRILADYPYVLARADEVAVVGQGEASELDQMIDLVMQRHGVPSFLTSKLVSKYLARYGRTRLGGF